MPITIEPAAIAEQAYTAARELASAKIGVHYWPLGYTKEPDTNQHLLWAIVMGYNPIGDNKPDDPFADENHHICIKLGFQPANSMLQCDYDVDWLLPYDKQTGDVFDNLETLVYESDTAENLQRTIEEQIQYFRQQQQNNT